MQDLGPFVFLRALGLARLLPRGCTWLRHFQAPEHFAAPSPGPWRLPPRVSKTLASAPTPVQRLPLSASKKGLGDGIFSQVLSLHGHVFSLAAPWRGHPKAASPESTSSVHHGCTQLHSQARWWSPGDQCGVVLQENKREAAWLQAGLDTPPPSQLSRSSHTRGGPAGPLTVHHCPGFGHCLPKECSPPPRCCA